MRDLLSTIVDLIQYDFCEDDDNVQGNWAVTISGDHLTITYEPFDDSPFPAKTMVYQVSRIS